MRFAFVTHTALLYGANRSLLALLDEFTRCGHTCGVVGPEGPIGDACRARGLVFIRFQPVWWAVDATARRRPFWRLGAVRWLGAALFAQQALLRQVRAFAPDWIYSNSAATPSGWLLARRIGCRHLWHLREFLDRDFELQPQAGWPALRCALRRSPTTISVSLAVRHHFFGSTIASRHGVVYEGVGPLATLQATAAAGALRPPGAHAGPWRFVLVGMLQANKGQLLALRALALLHRQGIRGQLTLVGGGPDADLRREAEALGLADLVHFTGHLPDPTAELLAADTALMCSRAEAFGRTTVEAMAAARPVIGWAAGATPELVRPGVNGWLFDGTPEDLARAMATASSDPACAAALGARAAREVADGFTNERYAYGVLEHLSRQP